MKRNFAGPGPLQRHPGLLPEFPGIPLIEASLGGVIVAVNDSFCDLLLRSRSELVGRSVLEFTHHDDQAATRAAIDEASDRLTGWHPIQTRYLRGDGTSVWVRSTSMVLTEPDRVIGHVMDIDELVAARQSAHVAERRLAALIEHSADLITVLDGEGHLVQGNPAAERVLGWKVESFLNTDMLALIHPADVQRVVASLADTLSAPGLHPPITFRVATPTGEWVHLESVGNNQLGDPDIAGVIVNSRDVSEAVLHRERIQRNLDDVVTALALASEFRDPYTAGHQNDVAQHAKAIAVSVGVDEEEVRGITLAASLHDIGKIAIPAEILTRPGRLSPIEFELVKTHSQIGHDILKGIDFGYPVAEIVLHHHERLDGSGYPNALAGGEVSLGARIVAVADVFDAMSSHRPYRPSLGLDSAFQHLRSNCGSLYDASIVDAFVEICRAPGHLPSAA